MNWQRSRVETLAKRLLHFALLLAVLTSMAMAQDAAATKPAQPAATDNPPAGATAIRPDSYVIGAEDGLSIFVWKEPEMSKSVPVRPDGMISLPLIGEVKAAGYTPVQLQDILAAAMKKYVSDPQVTVVVEKVSSLRFIIVGEIGHPG
jgi:polysaccharide export outer membrane protein